MEHIQGGELFEHVVESGSLSEHDAARVVRQVASALSYCHQHGVVHRDIKPETWICYICYFLLPGTLNNHLLIGCFTWMMVPKSLQMFKMVGTQ